MDGHIRIGSVVYGIGSEVTDPDGWVWTLVEAMDGTRDPSEIVTEVSVQHAELEVSAADIRQAMADLTEAGFVEDAGAAPPPGLSAPERERYSRGMTLLRWMDLRPRKSSWDPQARLRRARVLLIGVGGTGGAAARDLVASGVGALHCVDPDVVELSNLNRQTLYGEHDLGTPRSTPHLERCGHSTRRSRSPVSGAKCAGPGTWQGCCRARWMETGGRPGTRTTCSCSPPTGPP